jgi:hypothetical protein
MLTKEENELLTGVGRGTPGGELLRRYWMPVACTGELTEEKPIKAFRLLRDRWRSAVSMPKAYGAPITVGSSTAPAGALSNRQSLCPAGLKIKSNMSRIRQNGSAV